MTWKKPLIEKGIREPPYLHYIKLAWFEYHFEDIIDETSRKHFIENFYEIAEAMGLFDKIEKNYGISFTFKNKDGTRKTYNFDSMDKNHVFTKYKWNKLYEDFKIDKLKHTHDTACERVERSKDIDTITDMKQLMQIDKKIKTSLMQMKSKSIREQKQSSSKESLKD